MLKKRFLLLAGFLGILFLSSCDILEFFEPGIKVEKISNYDISPDHTNIISLNCQNGNVTFQQSADADIHIQLTNSVDAGSYSDGTNYLAQNGTVIDTNNYGIILSQNTAYPDYWHIYSIEFSVIISLPSGININNQNIQLDNGNLNLNSSYHCEKLTLSTKNGNISISGLDVYSASVSTINGNINENVYNIFSHSCSTENGNVDVTINSFEELGSSAEVKSKNGNIEAYFPTGMRSSLDVTADLDNGEIDNQISFDFIVPTFLQNHFEGYNGSGLNTVHLQTGNGNIDIKP